MGRRNGLATRVVSVERELGIGVAMERVLFADFTLGVLFSWVLGGPLNGVSARCCSLC